MAAELEKIKISNESQRDRSLRLAYISFIFDCLEKVNDNFVVFRNKKVSYNDAFDDLYNQDLKTLVSLYKILEK